MIRKEWKKAGHNALLVQEPKSYEEAVAGPDANEWKEAMNKEHQSLLKNQTWSLTELPSGRKTIKSKWVFKVKTNEDGSVDRFKARLVAQGFSQRHGIDNDETFSPVATKATIRILIGLKAQGWHLRHVDVDTAYLNADIDAELYISQPKGFEKRGDQGEVLVCKLRKAIYGLKQAGLAWYDHLSKLLTKMKFRKSVHDPCLSSTTQASYLRHMWTTY